MDPTLALVHADHPALTTAAAVVLPGTAAPTIIPLAVLPPAVRAAWLLGDPRAPLAIRVGAALDTGRADAAWALLRGRAAPIDTDLALTRVLLTWSIAETARLRLPAGRSEMLELGPPDGPAAAPVDDAGLALDDVRGILSGLDWPRWLGPVLVSGPDDDRLVPRGRTWLARPVLPAIRLPPPGPGVRRRALAAAAITGLSLDLAGPPAGGWPAWLAIGCGEVAQAVARGEGPSPRAMLARRQAAGPAALRGLLTATEPDPALAMALCAPLLHSKRRHLLPNLLDLLRHDAGGESALGIAYGLTVEGLVTDR